MRTMVKNNTT